MNEPSGRDDIPTVGHLPRPREAAVYRIDALVREDDPSGRAKSDVADLVRLVAELEPDASIRVAFHKPASEVRIDGRVTLFGSAAAEVSFRELQFVLGNTLFLAENPVDAATETTAGEPHPRFSSAYELSRVAIAPTVFASAPEAHDMHTLLAEPVTPRPTFAAPTADGWDSTAYVLKLMAQADGEIWTWTDLAPAGDIEQQMVVDELSTIYTYAGMGRHTGTVVRARTVIAGRGVVSPMVRSALSRRSRELRLLRLDPTAAERLWVDPVAGLAGHATSQTHAEALTGIPGVWALRGVGMATKERPVPDRPLDPLPPTPAEPIRLGWATDAFGQHADVALDVADLPRHCFIEGRSGSGKTTLLAQLFWSITRAGHQVIWFDPHGDGAARAAAYSSSLDDRTTHYVRHGDRAHPIRINVFAEKDAESRERMLAELLELIQTMLDPHKEGMVGERFKRAVSLVAQSAFELFGPRASITDVLALTLTKEALRELRDAIRPRSRDLAIRLNAELIQLGDREFAELVSWLVSRLQPFLRTPALRDILGTGEDSLDMLDVIDSGANLIVDLASLELGEDVARVLGALWLLKVRNAISRRRDRTRPITLLVDEAHLYTFGALPSLLAEARKFGIGIVIATQTSDNLAPQLARAIEANCGSAVSLRTGISAANTASDRLGGWPARHLTRLEDLTAAASLSRGGVPTRAFTLHVDHFTAVEAAGWDQEAITRHADAVFRASAKRLWAPYRDHRVLDDSQVVSLVKESKARAQRPAESTAVRTSNLLDGWARLAPASDAKDSTAEPLPAGMCDVILDGHGDNQLQVIKTIEEATRLGLVTVKALTDAAGTTVLRAVPHAHATALQQKLLRLGADARVVAFGANRR